MTNAVLDLINRLMDEQVARKAVPQGFPDLPDIPTSRYIAREFADLETKHIWEKTWLLVGVQNDLPQAGSYFLFERLGRSIIISRGRDGIIRAFHNSCRHRGSALLTEPAGKAMRFICPYHSWGYDLTGKLESVASAHDFPCLDKSERSLVPVKCEIFREFIFINMDSDARPVHEYLKSIVPSIEGFPLEGLVTKGVYTFEMPCNWKIAYHNFQEIYHVSTLHPVTLSPYLDSPSHFISLLDKGHSRIAARKRKGRSLYENSGPAPAGANVMFSEMSIGMVIFPNVFNAFDLSGFQPLSIWPAGIDKSIMEVRMIGWISSPDDEGYWDTVRKRGHDILSEDRRLFPGLQRSIESGVIDRIKFGYQERAIYWFEEEVDRKIGPQNIPENMRVAQVLADYAEATAR